MSPTTSAAAQASDPPLEAEQIEIPLEDPARGVTAIVQVGDRALVTFGAAELWSSDGTAEGSFRIDLPAPLDRVTGVTNETSDVLGDSRHYFFASVRNVPDSWEVWATDGTQEGTEKLVDGAALASSEPTELTAFGDRVAFLATHDPSGERRVYYLDEDAPSGAYAVSGVAVDEDVPAYRQLVDLGDLLLFGSVDGTQRVLQTVDQDGVATPIWDATAAGDPWTGPPARWLTFGDLAYFRVEVEGVPAVWVTDGTSAGTTRLTGEGAYPETFSHEPQFTVIGDEVHFVAAESQEHAPDYRLWATDGTREGTRNIWDDERREGEEIGPRWSVPQRLVPVDDQLLYRDPVWSAKLVNHHTRSEVMLDGESIMMLGANHLSVVGGAWIATTWGVVRTDGTSEGTAEVKTAWDEELRVAHSLTAVGDAMWLGARVDSVSSTWKLWRVGPPLATTDPEPDPDPDPDPTPEPDPEPDPDPEPEPEPEPDPDPEPEPGGESVSVLACDEVEAAGFTDVVPGSTHADAIGCLAGAGLVRGFPDGTFRPRDSMTRGQTASVLHRALEEAGLLDGQKPRSAPADAGGTHAGSIGALVDLDIMEGFADGSFRPDEPVTRAQLVSVMARATRTIGVDTTSQSGGFPDVSGVHEGNVGWAVDAGVAYGYADGAFRPHEDVQRAQAASLIERWSAWLGSPTRR